MATQVIGFSNVYYTLWSVRTEPVYTTDAYGKHWLTGYNTYYMYHKNISHDLEKAKALHPDLEVNEDLRGKTSSWVSENKEDLCPHIMKFGKHIGRDINELVSTDFQYIIWLCENMGNSSNAKYAKSLQVVIAYFQEIEDSVNRKLTGRDKAFSDLLSAGFYEFIAEKNLKIGEGFAYAYILDDDLCVTLKFNPGTYSENEYNGFPYGLPIINGKAKRVKGKKIRVEFVEDKSEFYQVAVTKISIQ